MERLRCWRAEEKLRPLRARCRHYAAAVHAGQSGRRANPCVALEGTGNPLRQPAGGGDYPPVWANAPRSHIGAGRLLLPADMASVTEAARRAKRARRSPVHLAGGEVAECRGVSQDQLALIQRNKMQPVREFGRTNGEFERRPRLGQSLHSAPSWSSRGIVRGGNLESHNGTGPGVAMDGRFRRGPD